MAPLQSITGKISLKMACCVTVRPQKVPFETEISCRVESCIHVWVEMHRMQLCDESGCMPEPWVAVGVTGVSAGCAESSDTKEEEWATATARGRVVQ